MNFLYGKLHIRVCFAGLSQIKLQQLFTENESIVLKSLPAVLYFTASEKDNLRTEIESYSYKEQKPSQCTGKQNYVMKNEKNSVYYYLSKLWATEKWSWVSLLAFYFWESLISAKFVHSDAL